MGADLHDLPCGARRIHHRATLLNGVPDRLFHVDMGTRLHSGIMINGCQWSGVPTMTISGFSLSNSSR